MNKLDIEEIERVCDEAHSLISEQPNIVAWLCALVELSADLIKELGKEGICLDLKAEILTEKSGKHTTH